MQNNAIFSKTKQFKATVSINDLYRKSYMGFSKNPLLDPYNPRWLRYVILKIDMTSFFSAKGGPIFCLLVFFNYYHSWWIKMSKISQTGTEWHVDCGDVWKWKLDVEFQYAGRLGEFSPCHPRATYHIAGCCHLVNLLSRFQSHIPHCRVQSPDEINVVIVPHRKV